jgi:hypothetical protein
MGQSQPGQIIHETLYQKTLHKNKAGGVAQGKGLKFKPQYRKEKSKNEVKPEKLSKSINVTQVINSLCFIRTKGYALNKNTWIYC